MTIFMKLSMGNTPLKTTLPSNFSNSQSSIILIWWACKLLKWEEIATPFNVGY
jgi:hypothetical protein